MATSRIVYHVVPNADATGWVISKEGHNRYREEFETKEEAVEVAKMRARADEPSQVKVHYSNGIMEYESTYGSDPAR